MDVGLRLAQSWRATGDHTGTWSSTKKIIAESAAIPKEYTGKQYGWNDLDMLETGNYEQAAHANGKESNMTDIEYKTEFSMWAISASPLVVTTPIMNCSCWIRFRCATPELGNRTRGFDFLYDFVEETVLECGMYARNFFRMFRWKSFDVDRSWMSRSIRCGRSYRSV